MTVDGRATGSDKDDQVTPVDDVPTSGQTCCQKVQFSMGIVSPICCQTVMSLSKDIYILELGADAQVMGVVFTVVSVWSVLCSPIVGYLMDRDLLTRYFPWERWGRRAPWFLINIGVASVSTALMYVPLSLNRGFLCYWFMGCAVVQVFALNVLFTAFMATRVEVYPTKEERSEGEFYVKFAAGLGSILGIAPQLMIAAGATLQARLMSSVFYLLVATVSLLALPIFRMARQEYDASQVSTPLRELSSLLHIPAYRRFLLYLFMNAMAESIMLSLMIYYLTVVEGLAGAKRSFFILAIGGILALVTLMVMIPWKAFFGKRRRGINPNAVAGFICGLGVVAPLAMLLAEAILPAPAGIIIYIAIEQATWTGQTFWRLVAIGWLVDEDSLAVAKRRREAVFSAGASLVSATGGAVAASIVLNGLAAAGLDMANCSEQCTGVVGRSEADCVDLCQAADIARQPQAVTTYMRILLCVCVPVIQLAAAVLTFTFPIKGDRLEAIYDGQARNFKPCAAVVGKAQPDKNIDSLGLVASSLVATLPQSSPSIITDSTITTEFC